MLNLWYLAQRTIRINKESKEEPANKSIRAEKIQERMHEALPVKERWVEGASGLPDVTTPHTTSSSSVYFEFSSWVRQDKS